MQVVAQFDKNGALDIPESLIQSESQMGVEALVHCFPHKIDEICTRTIKRTFDEPERDQGYIYRLVALCTRIDDKEYILDRFDQACKEAPEKIKPVPFDWEPVGLRSHRLQNWAGFLTSVFQ